MRRVAPWVVLAVAALAVARSAGWLGTGDRAERANPGPRAALSARVVRVVDGDTIRVRAEGRTERVRYIGVDTPESSRTPAECFARAATAANARLVEGERLRLVADAEARDRYGRLLAYVYRARDGRLVNAALLRGGYARTLTIEPNVRFAERFAALARQAREDGRGLWAACAIG